MKRLLLIVGLSLTAIDAWAINPQFESFFVGVCGSAPAGTLAVRCAETPAGTGDLSTDSESSLNPNQTLSAADSGLDAARLANEQAQERADRALSGQPQKDAVQVGPFSLLLNADTASAKFDRSVDSNAERASDSDSWGVELGFDYRVNPKWVVGMLVDWQSSHLEFDADNPGVLFTPQGNAGSNDVDRVGVTAFGALDTSANSFLEFSIGYLSADYDVSRNPVFQAAGRTVPQTNVRTKANVDGADFFAGVHWGYLRDWDSWQFGPYLGFFYARSEVDNYREHDLTGSGLAMEVEDYHRESELGLVGMRVSRGISFASGVAIPELRAEYTHEFARDAAHTKSSFLLDPTGNVYGLDGDDPDRDYAIVGAGVSFVLPNGWLPFIDYQRTLGYDDLDAWRVTAGLRHEL